MSTNDSQLQIFLSLWFQLHSIRSDWCSIVLLLVDQKVSSILAQQHQILGILIQQRDMSNCYFCDMFWCASITTVLGEMDASLIIFL